MSSLGSARSSCCGSGSFGAGGLTVWGSVREKSNAPASDRRDGATPTEPLVGGGVSSNDSGRPIVGGSLSLLAVFAAADSARTFTVAPVCSGTMRTNGLAQAGQLGRKRPGLGDFRFSLWAQYGQAMATVDPRTGAG